MKKKNIEILKQSSLLQAEYLQTIIQIHHIDTSLIRIARKYKDKFDEETKSELNDVVMLNIENKELIKKFV